MVDAAGLHPATQVGSIPTPRMLGSQAFKVMQLAFNLQNGGQYLGGLLTGCVTARP